MFCNNGCNNGCDNGIWIILLLCIFCGMGNCGNNGGCGCNNGNNGCGCNNSF